MNPPQKNCAKSCVCQLQPGQPGDSVAIVAVKKLPCEACGKIFSRGDKLRLHFRATHTTEEAPFSCSFCNKKFFRSDHWKKHEQRHVKRGQVRDPPRGRANNLSFFFFFFFVNENKTINGRVQGSRNTTKHGKGRAERH